jgi:hypothetical protein
MNGDNGVIKSRSEKENAMSDDDVKAELERLRRENERSRKELPTASA